MAPKVAETTPAAPLTRALQKFWGLGPKNLCTKNGLTRFSPVKEPFGAL